METKKVNQLDYELEYKCAMQKLKEVLDENEQYKKALLNLALYINK